MRSKRSIAPSAQWIVDLDQASDAIPTVPVGAVLATERLFWQLAHEAEVSWLVRGTKALAASAA